MRSGIYKYLFFLLAISVVLYSSRSVYNEHVENEAEENIYKNRYNDTKESVSYYVNRDQLFNKLRHDSTDIIFLGDSHFHLFELGEFFNDLRCKNRGISGDVSQGVFHRLDEVIEGRPSKVFYLIGTNDMGRFLPVDSTLKTIRKTIERILFESQTTKLYVHTVFPVVEGNRYYPNINRSILKLNKGIRKLVMNYKGVKLIDLHQVFVKNGQMNLKYTIDGIHLNYEGYSKWTELIKPHIRD